MGRTALVHDFLLDVRGGERVFAAICETWPEADVFTAVYDEQGTEGRFAHRRVHTSYLQRLKPTARTFRPLLPLYPHAVESFDLRGYDTVISSSSAWAHGVLVDPGAVHVCYCHNPFRYAWTEREATLAARHPLVRPVLRTVLDRWRQWDRIAAQRVDRYVANSRTTAARVRRCFGRDATVLHPPVELERFAAGGRQRVGEHYLVLAELMAHKRIDVAVRAFNRLGRPLVVVGDGPEARRLRRLAGPTVTFAGRVPDARAAELLASSRALVVTATEEFGIAAVESLAAGRPVIALADGGVRETVTEGETGTFFAAPDPDCARRGGRRASTRWRSTPSAAWPRPAASAATASGSSSPASSRRRCWPTPGPRGRADGPSTGSSAFSRAVASARRRSRPRRRARSARPGRRPGSGRRSSARRRWARGAAVSGLRQRTTTGVRVRSRSATIARCTGRGRDHAGRGDVVAGGVRAIGEHVEQRRAGGREVRAAPGHVQRRAGRRRAPDGRRDGLELARLRGRARGRRRPPRRAAARCPRAVRASGGRRPRPGRRRRRRPPPAPAPPAARRRAAAPPTPTRPAR